MVSNEVVSSKYNKKKLNQCKTNLYFWRSVLETNSEGII